MFFNALSLIKLALEVEILIFTFVLVLVGGFIATVATVYYACKLMRGK
jgi:hypothetical protein